MNSFLDIASKKRKSHIWPLLFVVFVGFILGYIYYLKFSNLAIAIVCGFLLLPILRLKPEIIILSIVILVSSIVFEEALPGVDIGIGYFHLADVLLLSLICLIPLKCLLDKGFRLVKTPLDVPLSLFYLAVLISACVAIFYYERSFSRTMRGVSVVTYYLVFFAVTNLIRNEKQVRFLVKGLFCIGFVVGIMMLAQAIVGDSVQLMPGRVEKADTFDVVYEATRILPPGQALIYVLFITSVISIALQDRKFVSLWLYFVTFLTGIGVTLTYNRNYWVSCIFCFILFMFFVDSEVRKRVIRIFLIGFLVIGLSVLPFLLSNPRGGVVQTMTAISDRFGSLFTGRKLYESDSVEWRRIENEYALPQIANNPLVGIGLGTPYRPPVFGPDDNLTWYIHNGYLSIALNFGVIGTLPFLWFYLGFILRGFRSWKKIENKYLKSVVMGVTLSGIGMLGATMVAPMFTELYSIMVISIMAGLSEVIIRINERGSQEPFSH